MANILETSWVDKRSTMRQAGSTNINLLENLRGFNHLGVRPFMPKNKDGKGLVFFTRPQLNLSLANLQSNRKFIGLLNEQDASVVKYVRCMLDPRLIGGYKIGNNVKTEIADTYLNNQHAFIPLLTNNLLTATGWPDIQVPSYTGRPDGLYGQNHSMVDGVVDIMGQVTINASFRTSAGHPITNMMAFWAKYMAAVFEGKLSPYPDFIIENELDYNTRMFRLVFDSTNRFLTNIGSTGPGFPEAVGIGRLFDFNSEETYNDTGDEVDFSFKFHGVEYNDPILIYEFNKAVNTFKPGMLLPGDDKTLMKIPHNLKQYFNYEGYPHINFTTGEYELFIEKAIVEKMFGSKVPSAQKDEVGGKLNESIEKGRNRANIEKEGFVDITTGGSSELNLQ